MKSSISVFIMTILLVFTFSQSAFAYSYGNPGEEQLAEAYKELETYLEQDDWKNARLIIDTYQKDLDLYFTNVIPPIEKSFETKDKQLLLTSYQAVLRLNIERRLYFAEEQFDDYGQAKLLLAKARGTFNVLAPIVTETAGQEVVDKVYEAFDTALEALGNPGLFGIGSQTSDKQLFLDQVSLINSTIQPLFPIPSEVDEGDAHLTEENLDFLDNAKEFGSSSFWLWFSVALFVILSILMITKRKKKS